MALKQERFLQPLRSGVLGSKELAVQALKDLAAQLPADKADGTIAVARYSVEGGAVKTVLGIFAISEQKNTMTIFDTDEDELKGLLAEIGALKEKDTNLEGRIETLELEPAKLDALTKKVAELEKEPAKLVALTERVDTLEGGAEVTGSVDNKVKLAVEALDAAKVGKPGQFIESVEEVDGVVTAVAKQLVDAKDKVLSTGETGVKATLSVVKETENLEANVLEQFKLVGTDGATALGETIKVYKDKALKTVKIGKADAKINVQTGEFTSEGTKEAADALLFVYHKEDGAYELVAVNVADFLRESEFGNGLQVLNGVVSVKENESASEKFLKVSEAGVEVTGVTAAIEAKVNASKVVVEAKEGDHVQVAVVTTNGEGSTVKVSESDIASAAGLAAEIERATAEEAKMLLQQSFNAYIKDVLGQEGEAYVADQNTNYLKQAASFKDADKKLDAQIKLNTDAISNLTSGQDNAIDAKINALDVSDSAVEGQFVDSVSETDGKVAVSRRALVSADLNNAIKLGTTDKGVFLDTLWDCGTF